MATVTFRRPVLACRKVPMILARPTDTAHAQAALLSVGAVLVAGIIVLPQATMGPISLQMVQHLFLMNVAAPLAAIAMAPFFRRASPLFLLAFAGLQMGLLWASHVPPVARALGEEIALQLAAVAALGTAALLFWTAVFGASRHGRWGAVAGLLVTGKLACLLGGLLVFAPRDLYGLPDFVLVFCRAGASTLEDQQLAGLIMITACPLSYVTAGVALAAVALRPAEDEPDALAARQG